MERWKARWEIIEEQVSCRTCGARQSARDATRPLQHREGCTAAIAAKQMPWRDLAAVLRRELGQAS